MSRGRESNPRPADYKSAALPTELPRLNIFERTFLFWTAKVVEFKYKQNSSEYFFYIFQKELKTFSNVTKKLQQNCSFL